MKKQDSFLRRLTALALTLCMLAALTAEIFAANIIASGYCGGEGDGTNLSWTLDSEGTLTISGTGPMKDYSLASGNRAPWYSSRNNCKILILGSGVTSIGDWAFRECSSLTGSLTIPNGVTYIGNNAFAYCRGFTGSLTIPNSVTYIGGYAFTTCTGFTGNLTIGDGVISIENAAFYGCNGFTGSLKIGSNVTSIGKEAFTSCRGFTGSLIIPDSVTSIGQQAFSFCAGLNGSLIIGNGVTKIQSWAFRDCTGLKKVIIGSGVTSVSNESFIRCNSVSGFYLRGNAPTVYLNVTGVGGPFLRGVPLYYIPGTTGWTDNSAYDAAAGTWNGYPLKTWNGKTIAAAAKVTVPSGKYCIQAVDENGMPISGANVTWDSASATTDADGKVSFSAVTGGNPVIEVSKAGYLTWTNAGSNWQKSDTRFEQVILYPESSGGLKLKAARLGSCDLLTQTKTLNLRNDGALIGDLNSGLFALSCAATDTSAVTGYAVYQNGKKIAESTDGNFQKLDVRSFSLGGGCFIRVTDKDGKTADTRINLQFAKNSVNKETKLELKGKKINIKVSDKVPFVGGSSLGFELPIEAPVVISCTDDTIQMGINLKLNNQKSTEEQMRDYIGKIKELEKVYRLKNNNWPLKRNLTQLKKYAKQHNEFKMFKSVDFTVCGYAEQKFGCSTANGYLMIIADIKVLNWEYNTVLWVVPVTVQVSADLKLEAGGTVSYQFDTETWSGNVSFNPTFALNPFMGVGFSKLAGAGVYGNGELAAKWNVFGTEQGLRSVDLTGELGLKAYIGWLEAKKAFAHQTWHLYTANSVTSQSVQAAGEAWDAPLTAAEFAPSDLGYLAAESGWAPAPVQTYGLLRDVQMKTAYQTLIENTYRNAQPVMVSDASALYAAFVRADASTGARYIVVTKFDGTSWSDPSRIDADAILDDAPQLCVGKDGKLWLAYAKTTENPGDSLTAYAEHQTIVVGELDKNTLAFQQAKAYSSDEYMRLPTLACVNGSAVLAWAQSAVTDENSVVAPQSGTVWMAECKAGVWGEARKTADAGAVTSLCIGVKNGLPAVACTVDGKLLCGGDVLAENVTGSAVYGRLPGTEADSFIWSADGALYDEAGTVVPAEGIGRELVIVGDNVYYSKIDGAGANLAVLQYDAANSRWNAPVCLIGDEKYMENLNVASLNGKTIALGMHTTVTIGEDSVEDVKDLVWTEILPVNDLKLLAVSFDEEALVPGQELPVTLTVQNAGDHTVTAVAASVDGASLGELPCEILPGESAELTAAITCPSEKKTLEFSVQEPDQEDCTPADNAADVTVGSADAELALSLVQIGSRRSLMATVVNHGLEAASGSILFTGADGQPLAERTFESLGYGGTVVAEYVPESLAALYGGDVTAVVTLEQDETNLLNNTDSVPIMAESNGITSMTFASDTVAAEVVCVQSGARAICAFYDAKGRLLTAAVRPLTSGPNKLSFPAAAGAVRAKLFVLGADSAPLTAPETRTLNT